MDSFRTRLAAGLIGDRGSSKDWQDLPAVTVKMVKRSEYETARKSLDFGEVIVTCASPEMAVASFIRTVEVMVKNVFIGKLHLRFYEDHRRVKRNFVTHDPQVRKLLGRKRERLALNSVDWLGDTSEEVVRMIAKDAIQEIELLCVEQPTKAGKALNTQSRPFLVAKPVPDVQRAEKPVAFQAAPKAELPSNNAAAALAVLQQSVEREAKGVRTVGVVTEMGRTRRSSASGGFISFCLKIDKNGTHIPFYGVELERECAERGVKAGMRVEVIDMGKQRIDDDKIKNLYRINVLN
ncbi:hypothetical protein [Comamonas thiooxydans]|uniref:hypothetical protein n=1 Tax=Comamonas thiooxydans TaxID=363952 RepID=UPI00050F2AE9|nr:hypothetical protein [Comamonas thiooxydans]KGH23031.1 hypothetical protein P606_13435 [Comamonas thiooxydans]